MALPYESAETLYNKQQSNLSHVCSKAKECYCDTMLCTNCRQKQMKILKNSTKQLDHTLAEIRKKSTTVIIGDFNATVEDATTSDVLEKYGHNGRNQRGQTLVDFCAEHKLVNTNTFF